MMSISKLRALACVFMVVLGACPSDDETPPPDAGSDSAAPPGAMPDASMVLDAADPHDAWVPPAVDAALNDTGVARDAALVDATSDAGGAALDPSVPSRLLSETGLYGDTEQKLLAPGVQSYQVRSELWADGATKKRFLFLPPGSQIDTRDPDAWVFPLGTKVWKEFTRDGIRVETRLIEKAGQGQDGWKYSAYAWNAAQTRAEAVPLGATAALGTAHDIPTQTNCFACHMGSPDFVLGVSAFGLPLDGEPVSLAALASAGRLSNPIAADQVAIPGDSKTQAALGVLHANCGHCHRPGTLAWEKANLELRLKVGAKTVPQTAIYMSSVGIKVGQIFENIPYRITAGKPAESAVYTRMTSRVEMVGMPSVGTKVVDTAGSQVVFDWIRSLVP